MSRPSNSDSGSGDIGFAVAAMVGVLVVKELGLQGAVFGLIGLIKEGAVFGLIGLIAAGVFLLAIALGCRVLAPCLAPWKARRRARRREARLEGLRDTFCAKGNDHLLPMISPRISRDQGSDPPRPFDPQAAARFREVLEFGDPCTALRAAGLRESDVLAWLDAGLSWAPEGDPRRDFAMKILEFHWRRRSRRGLMIAGEPHAPMLGGLAHPGRRRDEINVSPLPDIEYPD
jgi:hypothetical protein